MTELVAAIAAAVLAAVHLFAGRLDFLDVIPRSRWLSAAGGTSVAYVFVHLLPELSEGQEVIAGEVGEALAFLDRHVYLIALAGLVGFYGLELLARRHGPVRAEDAGRAREQTAARAEDAEEAEPIAASPVFRIHVASFALYNALVGYLLLHREPAEEEDLLSLALFATAMATHFLVNDYGLRQHQRAAYRRYGRWVLATAVILGWAIGFAYEVPEAAVFALLAVLGGGVILNVLKEELPEERESRFSAFFLGAAGYAALLLAI